MVEYKDGSRRLYLAKGGIQDIHIDASLPQHQIEGIRFLYRLFAKKKPGVILNDPSGYGKRVQTVLFLNAVRPLLDRPVLVLCKEGNEEKWLKHFRVWSQLGREVSVQLCNPPVLKWWVCINPMCDVSTFSRREWSAVVVDDTSVAREVLRADIHTNFKMWLTRVDMKKSLQTFSLIYKWIYPKGKFNVEDFQATNRKPSVVHAKSIILDAFMEDIVIRRKADLLTFGNKDTLHTAPKVTRKNKDATGKKIKRTKRAHEDIPSEPTNDVPAKVAKDVIENFIFNLNNSNPNDVKSDETLENLTQKTDDEKIQNKKNKSNQINNVNDNKKSMESDEILTPNSDDEVIQYEVINNEYKPNEIENILKDNKKTLGNNKINHVKMDSEPVTCNTQESCELLNNTVSSQEIILKYDSDTPDIDEIKLNIDNINGTDIRVTKEIQESLDLFSGEVYEIGGSDIISNKKNADIESDEINNENRKSDCEKTKDSPNEVKSDKENKDELVVSENKTGPELNGIELKIQQLEELTMKKFKGSVLDSIF